MNVARGARAAELILLAVGCCSAAALALRMSLSRAYGAFADANAMHAAPEHTTQVPASGSLMGELRLPRLQLQVPVREGCDPQVLTLGACHVAGTASFGGLGTVGIAGHRDASFQSLRAVHAGDVFVLSGPGGSYRYQVDRTAVVLPEDVAVLETAEKPQLVLITCYPFGYLGAAPKRLIVLAHLLSVAPET